MRRQRRGYILAILLIVIAVLILAGLLFNRPLPIREWAGWQAVPSPSPSPSAVPTPTSTPTLTSAPTPTPTPIPTSTSIPYTPEPTLSFEQADFVNAARYENVDALKAALLDARAVLSPQVTARLDKRVTLNAIKALLAIFDGTIEYAYGTLSGSTDLCMLISFTYTPGAKIAQAYKQGTTAGLTDAERRVFESANAWLESQQPSLLSNLRSYQLSSPLLMERAIHDFVCTNAQYFDDRTSAPTATLRDYQTAIGLFEDKRGNCMAYSDAFLMLARMAGFECDTIIGEAADENGQWIGHAWNMIKIDDQWLMLDATYDDLDSPPFTMSYAYFNVDARTIAADHRWVDGAMYRPVSQSPSTTNGFGNSLFPDLKRAQNVDVFKQQFKLAASDGGATETWFMLDGFSVTTELLQSWLQEWRLPGQWLMIYQDVGVNQYWMFHLQK
ncbi:hypothetical protein FACS1894184_05330 [Clostridia bacterium]|nr:hypothetical protein FACS1894184_05330 [Clostridia bacterium]